MTTEQVQKDQADYFRESAYKTIEVAMPSQPTSTQRQAGNISLQQRTPGLLSLPLIRRNHNVSESRFPTSKTSPKLSKILEEVVHDMQRIELPKHSYSKREAMFEMPRKNSKNLKVKDVTNTK